MTELNKFCIEGLNIEYKTWGDQKNPLVLALHGWLDNADSFKKIAPEISKTHYVVALDFPGHGFSNHRAPSGAYYLWDYAVDILKIIEQQKWKRFSIIAHSMGTGVAAIIAAIKPEMLEKLVFIDGLGAPFVTKDENIVSHFQRSYRQMEMAKKMKLHGFSNKEQALFKTKEEAIQERMKSTISPLSSEASKIIIERSLKPVGKGFRWRFDPRLIIPECYQITEDQARIFLNKIKCQTLLILGTNGLFSRTKQQERIKFINHVTVRWVEGGHHPHLEDASAQIQKLINQFIDFSAEQIRA